MRRGRQDAAGFAQRVGLESPPARSRQASRVSADRPRTARLRPCMDTEDRQHALSADCDPSPESLELSVPWPNGWSPRGCPNRPPERGRTLDPRANAIAAGHDDPMHRWRRHAVTGSGLFLAVAVLASCSSSRSGDQGQHAHRSTTTAHRHRDHVGRRRQLTTQPGVAVPNIIGLKIAAARSALRDVGLLGVDVNKPCNKGTLPARASWTRWRSPARNPPGRRRRARRHRGAGSPRAPGSASPGRAATAMPSSCPTSSGLSFAVAKRHHRRAGPDLGVLFRRAAEEDQTSSDNVVFHPHDGASTASTALASHHDDTADDGVVLTQDPHAGGVLRPGATVALTMHACPQ